MTSEAGSTPRSQEAHYERLLAPIYAWMVGDFAAAVERSRAELASLGVTAAGPGARALDLGAGLGLQSIPLAELGYAVTAVDTSEELLAGLSVRRGDVRCVRADLRACEAAVGGAYDVIVCMGDTLTHLPSHEDVSLLLRSARRLLSEGGLLALGFRDYATRRRDGTDRFLLVRADADRTLTVCLDYGDATVRVTDLVHERTGDRWALRASEYDKLRISGDWLRSEIVRAGLDAPRLETAEGVIRAVARK